MLGLSKEMDQGYFTPESRSTTSPQDFGASQSSGRYTDDRKVTVSRRVLTMGSDVWVRRLAVGRLAFDVPGCCVCTLSPSAGHIPAGFI